MKIKKISKNIKKYEFEKTKISNLAEAQKKLKKYISISKLGTYGGVNTDILYGKFKSLGYNIEREEVCPEDDELIGLRMPNFWPINQGEYSLDIAQYYNFIQQKQRMKESGFDNWNLDIRKDYGWMGVVEIFDTSKLVKRLKEENHSFFSVPYTLTECMRFLEGHESKRLDVYEKYANVILEWTKKQDFYNPSEWFLGKDESWKIQKSSKKLLNPKFAVKAFWQQELLNKRYDFKDRELNVVSREFSNNRNPDVILIGEDFLEIEGLNAKYNKDKHNLISWFEKSKNKRTSFPIKKRDAKNNQYKNAVILSEENPESKIVMLSYSPSTEKLFQLSKNNLEKESVNLETIFSAQAYFNEQGYFSFVKGLEDCLE